MRLHVDVGLSLRGTRHLVEGLVTVWDFPTAIHVMQLRPDRPVIIWGVLQGRHSYDLLLLPATSSPSGESPAPVTAKNGTKETPHIVTNPLRKKLSRWEYFLVTVALITVFAMCDSYKESIYWHVTCWLITCHVAWTFFLSTFTWYTNPTVRRQKYFCSAGATWQDLSQWQANLSQVLCWTN